MKTSSIELKKFGRDINGNSKIYFSIIASKNVSNSDVHLNSRKINTSNNFLSASIQTNGNLPNTHDLRGNKVKNLTTIETDSIKNEIRDYIQQYGTDKQKFYLIP